MTIQLIVVLASFFAMLVLNVILERHNKKLRKIIEDQCTILDDHNLVIIPTLIENLRFHIGQAIEQEQYEKAKEYSEMIMKLEGFIIEDITLSSK